MRDTTHIETETYNAIDEIYSELNPLFDEIKNVCEKYSDALTADEKQEVEYLLLSEVGVIKI